MSIEDIGKLVHSSGSLVYDSSQGNRLIYYHEPPPVEDPSGLLTCNDATTSSILLYYSFEDSVSGEVSIFQGSTLLVTFSGVNGFGNYEVTGLDAGTEYQFYLRDGASSSDDLLDNAICSTLEADPDQDTDPPETGWVGMAGPDKLKKEGENRINTDAGYEGPIPNAEPGAWSNFVYDAAGSHSTITSVLARRSRKYSDSNNPGHDEVEYFSVRHVSKTNLGASAFVPKCGQVITRVKFRVYKHEAASSYPRWSGWAPSYDIRFKLVYGAYSSIPTSNWYYWLSGTQIRTSIPSSGGPDYVERVYPVEFYIPGDNYVYLSYTVKWSSMRCPSFQPSGDPGDGTQEERRLVGIIYLTDIYTELP